MPLHDAYGSLQAHVLVVRWGLKHHVKRLVFTHGFSNLFLAMSERDM